MGLNSRVISDDDLLSELHGNCFSDVSADESTHTETKH
jgi:hypothetical protein